MSQPCVAHNKVVSVTYTIVDEADEIVEAVDIPVSYIQGAEGGLFEKIEQALDGKPVGERVEVKLTADEGFGQWDASKTFTDVIENVPPEFRKVGAEAEFYNDTGETLKMVVTHVDNGTVTLDGNHPFAGKNLTFYVTVTEVRDATADELRNGLNQQTPGTLH